MQLAADALHGFFFNVRGGQTSMEIQDGLEGANLFRTKFNVQNQKGSTGSGPV